MRESNTYSAGNQLSTVLIIDDDRAFRETLQGLLSKVYDCEISDGGDQVIERLEHRRYDVIISDVVMPGVDGLQILKRIRARHLKTPIIVISGNGDEFKDLFLEMGAFAYFTKPFRLEELEAAVAQAVDSIQ
jgi:DNA-binding NtrC family response regulator